MSTKNNSSFFESVAKHNLERFHSETIAWIFNTFPGAAKKFIKSIHTDILPSEEIELDLDNKYCFAELNQIDILLKYSYNSKSYQIIIENKMKASEHKIESKKLLKKGKKIDDYSEKQLDENEKKFLKSIIEDNEVKLSQTEYYYLREKMEQAEPIYTDYKYCNYVFLKPSKINEEKFKNHKKIKGDQFKKNPFNFEKLNDWNLELGINPWVTITYAQLINTIKESGAIENSEQILERYFKFKLDKKKVEDTIIANSYLNFIEENIKEEVDILNFNENEDYARFDYFKLLFALVKSKMPSYDQIEEYLEADSANGGMPLFAFYKKIPAKSEKFDFFAKKQEFINIGIQIQGENLKAYVSADKIVYDSTKIKAEAKKTEKNPEGKYEKFVKHVLGKITENWKIEDELIFIDQDKGFHPNSTKTFYSRSYKLKDFIKSKDNQHDNYRDIFEVADEISERVNHFVNFNIENLITNYNK